MTARLGNIGFYMHKLETLSNLDLDEQEPLLDLSQVQLKKLIYTLYQPIKIKIIPEKLVVSQNVDFPLLTSWYAKKFKEYYLKIGKVKIVQTKNKQKVIQHLATHQDKEAIINHYESQKSVIFQKVAIQYLNEKLGMREINEQILKNVSE